MLSGDSLSSSPPQCRYHYFGFCNTKESMCHHGRHLEITCEHGPACGDTYCRQVKRHPKYCRYYITGGFCSLGTKCRYTHINFINQIKVLKSEVENLKACIEKNDISEKPGKPKSKNPNPEHACPTCPKICLSSSGLKRHIQTKHIGEGLLQNSVTPKPEGVIKSKEENDARSQVQEESPKQSQSPNESQIQNSSSQDCPLGSPVSWRRNRKKELAFIIAEKLKSFYSKNPEDEDVNHPRKKFVFDIRTRKKFIYDNEERGIFSFTPDGGLAHTVFYNEFCGDIPSSQLGETTMDSYNTLQFSNVEKIRSLDEEHEGEQQDPHQDLDQDPGQDPDQGDQGADYGHHEDPGDQHHEPGHQHPDVQGPHGQLRRGQHPRQQEADDGQHQENSDHYHSDNSDQELDGQHQDSHPDDQELDEQHPDDQEEPDEQQEGDYEDAVSSSHSSLHTQDTEYNSQSDDEYCSNQLLNEINNYFNTRG